MNAIFKRVEKLYTKYGYTSFNYTKGRENEYQIYTSELGHHYFKTKEELLIFMDLIIETDPLEYMQQKLDRLLEYGDQLEEDIVDNNYYIDEMRKAITKKKEEV